MLRLRALKLVLVFIAASALAQDDSDEQSESKITDPVLECAPYDFPPLDPYRNELPESWTPAKLLANDAEAQAVWANISSRIPNIPVTDGTCSNYDSDNDPNCYWTCTQCTQPKHPGLPPDVSRVPEPMTLGYAFDDGPNCSHNLFYDYLASQNQTATMFVIGSNMMDLPLQGQRISADGHEFGCHTWSHPQMTTLSSEDAFAELWYTLKIIKILTGFRPKHWRPPYGDLDDRIRAIANALDLKTIIWGYDSEDWRVGVGNFHRSDSDGQMWLLINNLTAGRFDSHGAIILTHELNNSTMQEAIEWYPRLKSHFNHIVPIASALNNSHPYQGSVYTYPTFAEYIAGQRPSSGNDDS